MVIHKCGAGYKNQTQHKLNANTEVLFAIKDDCVASCPEKDDENEDETHCKFVKLR